MYENMQAYIGPGAGLATSVLWTGTSLLFTAGGKRIGPTWLNAIRIGLAIVLLGATHRLLAGAWLPPAVWGQVVFLAASGVVGLAIGDQALFTAFVDIGPRLAMLIMATSPIFAILFGWAALGETLGPLSWVGIVMTVVGVGWVVLERPAAPGRHACHRVRGLTLAFVAAACQAGGLLLSKQGIGHGWLPPEQHLTPQAATLVRMCFAGLGMVPILVIHGLRQRGRTRRSGSWGAGVGFVACGAVVGPYLGVWMSLVATDRAPLGIAQTLCSLSPVFLLPFAAMIHKERIGVRAVLGAVLAVGGSAVLFFHTPS